MKRTISLALATGLAMSLAVLALGTTVDEILARVEEEGLLGLGQTNLYAEFSWIVHGHGEEPAEFGLRVWSKAVPDSITMALLQLDAPEDLAGMRLLVHTPSEGDARLWTYMPELDMLREVVGDLAREGGFIPGSQVSYREMSEGLAYRDDYIAELLGEEMLDGVLCWHLELTPKTPADAEWTAIWLWVHAEGYFVMRAEFLNAAGAVERKIIAGEIDEDELGLFPRLMTLEDLTEKHSEQLRIVARSGAEVPDTYFEPENLRGLDL